MLLSREALVELTGYSQPKRMTAWLQANGWQFLPPERRGDVPKVSRAYFEARMSGQQPAGQKQRLRLDFMLQPS